MFLRDKHGPPARREARVLLAVVAPPVGDKAVLTVAIQTEETPIAMCLRVELGPAEAAEDDGLFKVDQLSDPGRVGLITAPAGVVLPPRMLLGVENFPAGKTFPQLMMLGNDYHRLTCPGLRPWFFFQ